MDTKSYEVKIKALKTAAEIPCNLVALRNGRRIASFLKDVESDFESIILPDGEYPIYQLYGAQCEYMESIPDSLRLSSKRTDLKASFAFCSKLRSVDISKFDTSQINDFNEMFYQCDNLQEINGVFDMSGIAGTNYRVSVYDMFWSCDKLQSVKMKNLPDDFFEKKTYQILPGYTEYKTGPECMGIDPRKIIIVE